MRFDPLIVVWLLLPACAIAFGMIGMQIWSPYRKKKIIAYNWIRRIGIVLLMLLCGLGVSVPGATSSPGVANLDVLFLVDTTASMGALDYKGSELRMTGVKSDLTAISTKLRGAHIGIITFDSKANTLLPFTPDGSVIGPAIQTVNREIYGTSKGSSIDKPLQLAVNQLKARKAAEPERSRLLFYLGDGESTTTDKPKPFTDLKQYVDGGAVLGYGTSKGARMLKYTGVDDSTSKAKKATAYITTPDPATKKFVPAVSKINEEALRTLAKDVGIEYHNRNQGTDIDKAVKGSKAEVLIDKGRSVKHYFNLYWFFAIPLVGLVFWEWKTLLLLLLGLRASTRRKKT